jgi:hypothetical protein
MEIDYFSEKYIDSMHTMLQRKTTSNEIPSKKWFQIHGIS